MEDAIQHAPIIVTAVLSALIQAFKQIPKIPGWTLPFIAFTAGIIAYCFLTSWSPLNAMNGFVVGAAAVGLHQGGVKALELVTKKGTK